MKKIGQWWVPDDETLQLDALEKGPWQIDHLQRAMTHVTTFDIAIDGGAHVGTWTDEMAQHFKMVLAYEPCGPTFDCLIENTRFLPNVRCFELALGEEHAIMGMREDERYGTGGNTGGRYLSGEGSVYVAPLDELAGEWRGRVGFLKLDVEGYELFALKGARRILERDHPVVLIEEKHRMAHRYNLAPGAARAFLVELGYRMVDEVGADKIFTLNKP